MTHSPPHGIAGLSAIVVMGVSGSGKTTIAKMMASRLGLPFRDADSFHPPANIAKMSAGQPLNDADRAPWLAAIAAWIGGFRREHACCVVTCSALKRAYRDAIRGGHDDVLIVYLRGDMTLIHDRMAERKHHFMPLELLASQFTTLEEPTPDEHALVVSIDATPTVITERALEGLRARVP
jgi:carbohydrate kinase (thermoresistant glucokinase family)